MNIFEIHHLTTSRIEPLHSQYLAACLKRSPELLREFWNLSTNSVKNWLPPEGIQGVQVCAEHALADGKRVDIVLMASDRLVAVEAKTTDSSVEPGQLEKYLMGLKDQYPDKDLWMAYLTPFNVDNKPAGLHGQEAIKEFDKFHRRHPSSSHLSWAQIVGLVWQGQDEVWRQHGEYVHDNICQPPSELVGWGRIDDDLSWETMRDFWEEVKRAGFYADEGVITLDPGNDPESLGTALRMLLMSERVRDKSKTERSFPTVLMRPFTNNPEYGRFHERIFRLLDEFPFLGIRGRGGYGLLLPVLGQHRVVSICTSKPDQPWLLMIGRKPK